MTPIKALIVRSFILEEKLIALMMKQNFAYHYLKFQKIFLKETLKAHHLMVMEQ